MPSHLLMLATGPGGAAGVDLDTGSLIRIYWIDAVDEPLSPYDVVEVDLTPDDRLPFAGDTYLAGAPVRTGRMTGRRAERLLRPLVHPQTQPLLGAPGPQVAYWTLRPESPSITLVHPTAGPAVERDQKLRLHCRFRWRRLDHDLLLDDPAVDERLSHPTATSLRGSTLARALGWRPHRLVIALTPPREGHCQKVVAGILPKP